MATVRSGTTDKDVLATVRNLLTSGELRPGEAVRQAELAALIGVSRVPVREALKTLEAVGLLQHAPNQSYVVAKLTFRELEAIYRMRKMLETDAILQTLANGTSERILWKMRRALDLEKALAQDDIVASTQLNRQFHFPLFEGATAMQIRLISQLWDCSDPYRILYYANVGHLERAHREHTAILRAVEDVDRDRIIELSDKHRQHGVNQLAPLVE